MAIWTVLDIPMSWKLKRDGLFISLDEDDDADLLAEPGAIFIVGIEGVVDNVNADRLAQVKAVVSYSD